MKVRFDTITSDSATSDADAGAKDRKDAVSLPEADWDGTSLAKTGQDSSESTSEPLTMSSHQCLRLCHHHPSLN